MNSLVAHRIFLPTILLAMSVMPAAATIIIDPFTSSQAVSVPSRSNAQTAVQGPTATNSTANNAPLALGGQRELYYRRLYGTSMGRLNSNSDNVDAVTFSTGPNGIANALLVYDGSATSTTLRSAGAVSVTNGTSASDAGTKVGQFRFGNPDTYGLNADLTEGGLNDRIRLQAYADNAGAEIVLRFLLSSTKYAEAKLSIVGSADFKYDAYDILFTDSQG